MELNDFNYSLGTFGQRIEQGIILSNAEIEKIEVCYIELEKVVLEAILGEYRALTPDSIILIDYNSGGTISVKRIKRNNATVEKKYVNFTMQEFPLKWVVETVIIKCMDGTECVFNKPKDEYFPKNSENFKKFVDKL